MIGRRLLALIVAALLMLPAATWAQLNVVGHYDGGGASLDIGTFTEKGQRVGIIGISHKVSITFQTSTIGTLKAIWRKAKKECGNSFHFVGSFKETGASYNSLLTVAAGPGIQFTINDKPGTYTVVLSQRDYARFDADLAKVAAYVQTK